jgi:uncharacterized membrane protein
MMDRYIFNPFTFIGLIILLVIVLFLIPLLFLGVIGGALTNLGFSWGEAFLILLLTLVGSFINIPLTTIETNEPVVIRQERSLFGHFYTIREMSPTTTIAINVGGAVIPVLISLYLFCCVLGLEGGLSVMLAALVGIAAVTLVTNRVARPVRGLGIATPFLIPPLCALVCALVLSWGDPVARPVIAYVSGTLGTLLGADILNLRRIGELGAPVVSIGGAGTFDGIFLTGIIAAFLA